MNITFDIHAMPEVKPGSIGDYVTLLQTKMSEAGYYKGNITGQFDNLTRDALVEFQRDNHIAITGYTGPVTWMMLFNRGGIFLADLKQIYLVV